MEPKGEDKFEVERGCGQGSVGRKKVGLLGREGREAEWSVGKRNEGVGRGDKKEGRQREGGLLNWFLGGEKRGGCMGSLGGEGDDYLIQYNLKE